ncbi:PREDICTED: NAI2-like protein [Camelina sativa]|uniref:NAI2-like protein n=1 Tax=Camelina sativa TaxID=90675 RepID=A0ABM0XKU6_CAMSA|nr:PREDICTED: NAI2-like protein [Camelina sativa]
MKISAMGRTSVVLGLAVCLFFSSFHEVSCQVEAGSTESGEFQDMPTNVDYTIQPEAVGGHQELGQSSSMDDIQRELDAYFGDKQDGSESDGAGKFGESNDAVGIDAERRQKLEEIEQQLKAAAATKIVVEEGTTRRKSKVETQEIEFEGVSSASAESSQQSSSYNGWKKSNGGSGMLGSLGISQSGAWRCFNQDRNGVNEEGDASIVIPKYDIDAIIKEESVSQGSKSKTSSLIASLTEIVEKHKKEKWSSGVSVTTGSSSSTETTKTVEKLKVTLKKYRSISARELVARSDFEEILAIAARYEELSSASVSYISRLSMYRSLIQEGIKASQRVQLAQARARLLKEMAAEKKKNVEAELALVKALAERGDLLYVKIFAIKKLVLKLEAEKEEVDMNFQKTVVNLSHVIEESSKAYEEYHVVVRKWKEEQAAEEFSREAIQSAEEVWVKFLGTL